MRRLKWPLAGALVVLASRALVYALSPSPLAAELSKQAGGPRLPLVAIVTVGLAVALSAAVLWLAALGVRERALLETRPLVATPRLAPHLVFARAFALWPATMLAFALLESYIHWRAGLGWHGLHCLTGPVHRDAIPVLGAFSLVAAALVGALEHVLAWMRRVAAVLAAQRRLAPVLPLQRSGTLPRRPVASFLARPSARGPPLLV